MFEVYCKTNYGVLGMKSSKNDEAMQNANMRYELLCGLENRDI
jgi:hypothetical protein